MNSDYAIMSALEVLAAAFPWEEVEIDVHRQPDGTVRYVTVINGSDDLKLSLACAHGETPMEAVEAMQRRFPNDERNPEKIRDKALAELQEKIKRLQQIVFSQPPYVPNRELLANNPSTISV